MLDRLSNLTYPLAIGNIRYKPCRVAFLALAVLSAVIWRTAILRATAIPLAVIGVVGAAGGPAFDVAVAPSGEMAAVRQGDGKLVVIGRRPSAFDAEQWLRADADGREARTAVAKDKCDTLGCVAHLADGRAVAVDLDRDAFAEDCSRAAVVVTPLYAPSGCKAQVVLDRDSLRRSGAVTLKIDAREKTGFAATTAREPDEDRPWSPKAKLLWHWDAGEDARTGQ